MTEDIVKLCKRLMGHPVICMDKQNITGDAAATIEALTKSLDIQIESSSTYARELEAEIERLTLDINALIKIDALNTAEIERLRKENEELIAKLVAKIANKKGPVWKKRARKALNNDKDD